MGCSCVGIIMSDYIVFVNMALFWVYMKRQNRWAGFIGALGGQYKIVASDQSIQNGAGTLGGAATGLSAAQNGSLSNVVTTTGGTTASTASGGSTVTV